MPHSSASSQWQFLQVFLRCFSLAHGGGAQAQLALKAHPASVISRRVTLCFQSVFLHQTQYATFKAIKRKLLQLMVHVKQWQKNRLKCLELPKFQVCLQAIRYFWQVIWRLDCSRCEVKRRCSKSHSWFLWGQIRITFWIVVCALEGNQSPMHPQSGLHPKTNTQRWGRVDSSTNCDKLDTWENWATYFFLVNSGF